MNPVVLAALLGAVFSVRVSQFSSKLQLGYLQNIPRLPVVSAVEGAVVKFQFLISVFIAQVLWTGAVSGGGGPALSVLACDGPSCDSVAEKVEYRYDKPLNAITLNTDHFSIEMPDDPIAKIVYSKEDLVILYENDQLLYISESKGPEIEDLESDLIYQYPSIIFLKTKKDVVPETESEKLFWGTALASKPFYFHGADKVSYSQKGDHAYYLSNTHELGFSARAMVTNSRYKHIFLVIEAKQMNFNAFRDVVFSVK